MIDNGGFPTLSVRSVIEIVSVSERTEPVVAFIAFWTSIGILPLYAVVFLLDPQVNEFALLLVLLLVHLASLLIGHGYNGR